MCAVSTMAHRQLAVFQGALEPPHLDMSVMSQLAEELPYFFLGVSVKRVTPGKNTSVTNKQAPFRQNKDRLAGKLVTLISGTARLILCINGWHVCKRA